MRRYAGKVESRGLWKALLVVMVMVFFMPFGMDGQTRKKSQKARKPQLTEEEIRAKERLEEMVSMAQRIVFIDSMVVDRDSVMEAIPLVGELGRIGLSRELMGDIGCDSTYGHINQLGDICRYSAPLGEGKVLYGRDKYGDKWGDPFRLKGLEQFGEGSLADWPFVMADGMTMYFSAKGEESIGGYDIFITRYDASSGKYLKAENIGMPFNSTANDYLYIEDEYDDIGWFVSDRRQPEGKVCIYVFIPSEVRSIYREEDRERQESLASIMSIADTWGDGIEREEAMGRLDGLRLRIEERGEVGIGDIEFVVNDDVTYRNMSEFKSDHNRELYAELLKSMDRKEQLDATIEREREYYRKAGEKLKGQLGEEIMAKERESEVLEKEIAERTKAIRNSENGL